MASSSSLASICRLYAARHMHVAACTQAERQTQFVDFDYLYGVCVCVVYVCMGSKRERLWSGDFPTNPITLSPYAPPSLSLSLSLKSHVNRMGCTFRRNNTVFIRFRTMTATLVLYLFTLYEIIKLNNRSSIDSVPVYRAKKNCDGDVISMAKVPRIASICHTLILIHNVIKSTQMTRKSLTTLENK